MAKPCVAWDVNQARPQIKKWKSEVDRLVKTTWKNAAELKKCFDTTLTTFTTALNKVNADARACVAAVPVVPVVPNGPLDPVDPNVAPGGVDGQWPQLN